jgi:hypothetical protein
MTLCNFDIWDVRSYNNLALCCCMLLGHVSLGTLLHNSKMNEMKDQIKLWFEIVGVDTLRSIWIELNWIYLHSTNQSTGWHHRIWNKSSTNA